MGADDGEQHVALRDLRVELLDEVESGLDGIDIDEDLAMREAAREVVVESSRHAGGVVSPIIDEDAGHAGRSIADASAVHYRLPRSITDVNSRPL